VQASLSRKGCPGIYSVTNFRYKEALYGYCTLEAALKEAGLLRKLSPLDLLEEFSKVYIVTDGEQEVISEIPRKVAELDKLLGIHVFPKMMRSYGLK
jgi:hypothetical protein